jgi:hypothetical protein
MASDMVVMGQCMEVAPAGFSDCALCACPRWRRPFSGGFAVGLMGYADEQPALALLTGTATTRLWTMPEV